MITMSGSPPIITVIMPVFNTEIFLKDAIDSVINQSFKDWELICVNDGSTDNSLNILKEYETLDDRIIVIDQKNSGTASAARNKALDHARGEFIHMLDSDDLFSSDCLEKAYKKYILTQADLVLPDLVLFVNKTSNIIKKIVGYNGDRELLISPKNGFISSLTWEISGVGMCRTELLKRLRYDETTGNGDELTTRLLFLNCNKIAFCSGTYFYRRHADSTTSKISPKRFDTILTDFKLLELSNHYDVGHNAIVLCKKRIVENIIYSEQFYLASRKHFNTAEKKQIQILIKKNYNKVNKSFIAYDGNIFKHVIRSLVFIDFRILKMYAFGINCLKFFLNIKY